MGMKKQIKDLKESMDSKVRSLTDISTSKVFDGNLLLNLSKDLKFLHKQFNEVITSLNDLIWGQHYLFKLIRQVDELHISPEMEKHFEVLKSDGEKSE